MQINAALLRSVTHNRANPANVNSVVVALNQYGALPAIQLHQPHRLAQYLAQIAHESGQFVFDTEVWGPTSAQKRYDTRTDLGNTAAADGDGHKYRGRTGIQITGLSNYRQFRDWCRSLGLNPPDFLADPDAVLLDPWEGLAPIWYWSTRELNRYADNNDIEMITRRINGGLNGYADRLTMYSKIGLGMLGHPYSQLGIEAFQQKAKGPGGYTGKVDGIDGPQTRAAIHRALVRMGTVPVAATSPSPVTEQVPLTPVNGDRTAVNRGAGALAILGAPLAAFAGMDNTGKLIVVAVAVVAAVILFTRGELVAKRIRDLRKEFME